MLIYKCAIWHINILCVYKRKWNNYLLLIYISTLAPLTLFRFWASIAYEFNSRTFSAFIVETVVDYLPLLHQITKHCNWFEHDKNVATVQVLSIRIKRAKLRCTCNDNVIIHILYDLLRVSYWFTSRPRVSFEQEGM